MNKRLNKLIEKRSKHGYSMEYVANKVGISVSYYCQIETGKRNLYYKTARKIAKVFKVKPDELFYSDIK